MTTIHPSKRTAITGALSFTGRYLAQHLLQQNHTTSILNLSSRTKPISSHNLTPTLSHKLQSHPLSFHNPTKLTQALQNVDILYCTYWIRFEQHGDTHFQAAERCKVLFECARDAGVSKVVFSAHTGISIDSPFSYIAGKAKAAEYLREISSSSNMKYAIVKPCGIFGDKASESILFNNAAYVLRRTPLFLLPQNGMAGFQPIYVQDMVKLMINVGHLSPTTTGEELDAVGPRPIPALELFRTLRDQTNPYCFVVPSYLPTWMIGNMTKPLDWYTGDVLLDTEDLNLMYNGLTVADDPEDTRIQGRKCVLDWMEEMGSELGKEYVHSVNRYYYPRE